MPHPTMDRILHQVRDGYATFDDLMRETSSDFRSLALYLMRRWTPPAWATTEDFVQELYLGAWGAIWRWEPNRSSMTLRKYVTYNAVAAAKRELHRARGAGVSGSPDKRPSHIETPIDMHEDMRARTLSEPAEQEARLLIQEERAEALAYALEVCESEGEREILKAIGRTGSVTTAAKVLYNNPTKRRKRQWDNEQHAERDALRAARKVVARLGGT